MTQAILVLPLVFGGALSSQPQTTSPNRAMAVPLPYVNPAQLEYLSNARSATDDILLALKSHRDPAVGFVNEGKLQAAGEPR